MIARSIFMLAVAILLPFVTYSEPDYSVMVNKVDDLYKNAISVSNSDPELALSILEQCNSVYNYNNDTLMMVETMITIGEINRLSLNTNKAFDVLWDVLPIAEDYKNDTLLIRIYENLGYLYSFYRKENESYEFMSKALEIAKQNYKHDKNTGQLLVSKYFNLAMLSNQYGKHEQSLTYLDSCFSISDEIGQDKVKRAYLQAEKGYIYFMQQKYTEAEKLMLEVKEIFEAINTKKLIYTNDKSYLIIIYSTLGDIYMWQRIYDKAIKYFKMSLESIDMYNSHLGLRGDLLYKLSDTYALTNNYKLAHQTLLDSKKFNDSVYGTKSIKNSHLIEIKNKHRELIHQKELEIAQTKAELYEKERGMFRIKVFMFSLVLIIIAGALLWILRKQRMKHIQKSKQDEQTIRNKNKELTSYTLQFIENEKFLSELTDYMKKNLPENKRQIEIMERAKKSRAKQWEDFNTRFLSVNKDFYKKLSKAYPDLTPTELKHCALMKLNFNSKDMAQLLNISVSSVHVSRHRIRKKMGLERDENLVNLITGV